MNAITQLAIICGLAIAGAGTSWLLIGSPDRSIACDPATIKADEICLQSIPAGADILWVDARSRSDWENNGLPNSLLWNLDPKEDMQTFEAEVAMQLVTTPRVIVYCSDESCGTSRQIAERIRNLDLGAEVHVLHGGWRALNEAGKIKAPNGKR